MEYSKKKRLCRLVEMVANDRDCAIFTVKGETSPLDLVRLGGFEGRERMLRVSKDPRTTCITVFRDGGEPYHMSYGSSTTLVGEDRRKVRDLVMECAGLDFGVFFRGEHHRGWDYDRMVEATVGLRDLNSQREFELQCSGGSCSMFVNHQHIGHIRQDRLEEWLAERDVELDVREARGLFPNGVRFGVMRRTGAPKGAEAEGKERRPCRTNAATR